MIYYNINALYHKEFLELASICSALLIKNGNVKKEQIRVTVSRQLLSCNLELVRLSNIVGYNGIRILDAHLSDWSPKTHIIDGFESDIEDAIVNIDADCFLTKKIDLDEYVTESIGNYEIAIYNWPTNAYDSYKARLTLAHEFFKPSLTSEYSYKSIVDGLLKESNINIESYETYIKQPENQFNWINGGFTIYSNKHLIQHWKTVLALNCITLSDEYVFSILDYIYKTTDSFGLNINILDSRSKVLPHHYLPPHGNMYEIGLLHLVGSTKTVKRNEIKELYNTFVIEH